MKKLKKAVLFKEKEIKQKLPSDEEIDAIIKEESEKKSMDALIDEAMECAIRISNSYLKKRNYEITGEETIMLRSYKYLLKHTNLSVPYSVYADEVRSWECSPHKKEVEEDLPF